MLEQILGYVPSLIGWLLGLLSMAEWRALVLLVAVTLAGTQIAKIIWRALPFTRGGRRALVNVFSVVLGFFFARALWPAVAAPWWAAGMVAGPAAIGIFKFFFPLLAWAAPGLAATLNRDRRRRDLGPPDGRERRAEARL